MGQEQGSRPVKRPKRTRKIKSAVMVLEEPASPTLQTLLLPPNEVTESASWSGRKEKVADPLIIDWSEQDKGEVVYSISGMLTNDLVLQRSSFLYIRNMDQISNKLLCPCLTR